MGQHKGYSVYQHGRQWYARISVAGRKYQKPLGEISRITREAAEEAARALVETLRGHVERARKPEAPQNPIVVMDRRLARRGQSHQDNCARYHIRLLAYFGQDRDIKTLTRADIERWRDWLLNEAPRDDDRPGHLAKKSVSEHLSWLAAVYNESGLPNPCRGVERPRRSHAEHVEEQDYFTPDELKALLETCQTERPEFYNALVFFVYTGCREAELTGIQNTPRQIDRAARIVRITGKGDKTRSLKLDGPTAPAWDALMRQVEWADLMGRGAIYYSLAAVTEAKVKGLQHIFPQSAGWAYHQTEELCKAALKGAKHGNPHKFRHTLATMALCRFQPTWDIAFLAKWLGHKDISTTYRIYGHLIATTPPSGFEF
jgi:integrase